jgi:hypothetical protein
VNGVRAQADIAGPRIVTGPMRMMIVPFVVLAGMGALDLYLLPQHTDRYFAWTLRPQASAMFMGAGYAAGVVMTVLSFRRQPWAVTRIATYSIFVFVVMMSWATLLHLDRMHFHSGPTSARAAAWLWIVVYIVVPVALAVLIVHEVREPGGDPPRRAPLAAGLRVVLGVQGAVMVGFGVALFAWPTQMDRVWPWPLTALSGRALASWLLAIGCAGVEAVFENDLPRLRPAFITYTVLGVLWLLALVRAGDEVRWGSASAWVYGAGLLSVSAAGAVGVRFAARVPRSETR